MRILFYSPKVRKVSKDRKTLQLHFILKRSQRQNFFSSF